MCISKCTYTYLCMKGALPLDLGSEGTASQEAEGRPRRRALGDPNAQSGPDPRRPPVVPEAAVGARPITINT